MRRQLNHIKIIQTATLHGDAISVLVIFTFTCAYMMCGAAQTYFWEDDWNWLHKVQQLEGNPWAAFAVGFSDVGWAIYRPLSLFCWALFYNLWGLNPAAYSFMTFIPYFSLAVVVFLFGKKVQGTLGGFLGAVIYMTFSLTLEKVALRAAFTGVLMAALEAGSLYCFWVFLEQPRGKRTLVLSLFLGVLGFLASEEGAFVCPMMAVFVLCHGVGGRWQPRHRLALWAALGLAATWWAILVLSRAYLLIPFRDAHFSTSPAVIMENAISYLKYYFQYHNGLLLVAAGFSLISHGPRGLKAALVAWAGIALIPILFLDFHTEYYLVQAMPGLCAVIGGAIAELLTWDREVRMSGATRSLARATGYLLSVVLAVGSLTAVGQVWVHHLPGIVLHTREQGEKFHELSDSLPPGGTLTLLDASDLERHFYSVSLKVLGRSDVQVVRQGGGEGPSRHP